jgi:hypothetical protein
LLVAGAGMAAVALARRRFGRPVPARTADDHAAELRRKLDESRVLAAEREEFESGETTVDRVEPAAESVDERRRRVHEQGRAAVDEMRSDADPPG